ncbi:MAG: hypothetical protein A2Y38_15505 [Spirochaetes bacterium GWB1_59_5]|nr:MAG: hypothetical protein A2Y38_15505 [Spirochaetes bacterium GWB1_59_5]
MTPQDPKTRAKELADAHWDNYNGPLLTLAGVDPFVLKLCAYIYKSAGCHFYKHAVDDIAAGIFRPRIGEPLTAAEVDDITDFATASGCQKGGCRHCDILAPCNCSLYGMAGPMTCKDYLDPDDSGEIIAPPSATIEEVCGILADRAAGEVIPPDLTPIATFGPLDLSLPSITQKGDLDAVMAKHLEEYHEWKNAPALSMAQFIEAWDCQQTIQTYQERGGNVNLLPYIMDGWLNARMQAGHPILQAKRIMEIKNAARGKYSPEDCARILANVY